MAQEIWLQEKQLPMLQQLGTQFVAASGMENSVSRSVMSGRPFGGVSIAWSPDLDCSISPISNFRHKRIVGVELKGETDDFLLLCAYMPFFDSSNRAECMSETIDALSMIETIIDQFPSHAVIIGGDMNTEFKGSSPFDPLWSDLMAKYDLSTCDHFLPSTTTTYHHQSMDHRKWNDHFVVSRKVLSRSILSNHEVLDEGDNVSDHLPITMRLTAQLQTMISSPEAQRPRSKLRWDKLNNVSRLH